VIHTAAGVFSGPDLFAINVVAPYVITAAMYLPKRSILITRSMHMAGSTDLAAVDFDVARTGSYEDSQLCMTTLSMLVANRLPGTLSHAVDAGWVPTPLLGPARRDRLSESHRTQAWLATAREEFINPRTGGYWHQHAPVAPSRAAVDLGFQGRLARKLESYTGLRLRTPKVEGLSAAASSS
jgi:hypothetical protein